MWRTILTHGPSNPRFVQAFVLINWEQVPIVFTEVGPRSSHMSPLVP